MPDGSRRPTAPWSVALLMKFGLGALVALSPGCSPLPTTPTPTPVSTPAVTRFWGMVIEQSGVCIAGATVAVVGGPSGLQGQAQETPCDVWGYSGGFAFTGLSPGVPMTLRASAPGYVARDVIVVPSSSGPGYNTVFEIVLSRSQ